MPYSAIAFAATIPGILYFVAVGVMVHFEATRQGLPVMPRADLPRLGAVLRRDALLLVAPALLVYFIVDGRSADVRGLLGPGRRPCSRAGSGARRGSGRRRCSASWSTAPPPRCPWRSPAPPSASWSAWCRRPASASSWRAASSGISGGNLLATLVLTMIAALVLGTGLPTSATYIITSIMAAPALVQLGMPKLVAHMFVFYFGILADLTPPTAISTYATSSIAGADVWRTQWTAMMLALSGFIIPFSFAYDPALLMLGAGPVHIAWRTASATLGIVMLGAGLIGHFRRPTRWWERGLLLGGALLLIFPGAVSDALGIVCFVAVWIAQRSATGRPSPDLVDRV